MRFEEWKPLYLEILKDFNFSQYEDEVAARVLCSLLESRDDNLSLEELSNLIEGRDVLICGNAPRLAVDLVEVRSKFDLEDVVVIAADGATTVLLNAGIIPSIIVTDLDGTVSDIILANEKGSVVVVHAHGDNMGALKEYVPQLSNILGTTQSRPFGSIYNFGGFTDGDRCVFLAQHFKAESIKLIGFDYDDSYVSFKKKMKLKWARRLIYMELGL